MTSARPLKNFLSPDFSNPFFAPPSGPIMAPPSPPTAHTPGSLGNREYADLMTQAGHDLGIFSYDFADRTAVRSLSARVRYLRDAHPNLLLEPFVAVNLPSKGWLNKIVEAYNNGARQELVVDSHYWDGLSLEAINKRSIGARPEPRTGIVRGHVLEAPSDPKYEAGLFASGYRQADQQAALDRLGGGTNLNVTDWLFIQYMRDLAGQPLLDSSGGSTLFVQQAIAPPAQGIDAKIGRGIVDYTGRPMLTYATDHKRKGYGVRFSLDRSVPATTKIPEVPVLPPLPTPHGHHH